MRIWGMRDDGGGGGVFVELAPFAFVLFQEQKESYGHPRRWI